MRRELGWPAAILIVAALALGVHHDRRPLSSSHEARVLETAREMEAAGDWVVPRFEGEVRLQKPPLPYWATMLAFRIAGEPSLPAARWAVAAAGLVAIASTWVVARALVDRRAAVMAMAVFAAGLLVHIEYRKATPDPFLAATCTLAVAAFAWTRRVRRAGGVALLVGGYAATALALLAKGPIALAFIALGAWAARGGDRPPLRPGPRVLLHAALGAFAVAPILAWAMLLIERVPDAWDTWRFEMGSRFSWDEDARELQERQRDEIRSPIVYGAALLKLVLPATLPFVLGLVPRSGVPRRAWWWFLIGFAFLLVLSSRKDAYLLPLATPAALLAAGVLAHSDLERARFSRAALALHAGLLVLASCCLLGVAIARHEDLTWPAAVVGGLLLAATGGLAAAFRPGATAGSRAAWTLVVGLLGIFLFQGIMRSHEPVRWSRYQLGAFLRGVLPADADFVAIGVRDPVVSFYARRTPRHVEAAPFRAAPPTRETWVLTDAATAASGLSGLGTEVARTAATDGTPEVVLRIPPR